MIIRMLTHIHFVMRAVFRIKMTTRTVIGADITSQVIWIRSFREGLISTISASADITFGAQAGPLNM